MADLTFYTHPQSRGQTIRWMLEEVGAPYDTEVLDYGSTTLIPQGWRFHLDRAGNLLCLK